MQYLLTKESNLSTSRKECEQKLDHIDGFMIEKQKGLNFINGNLKIPFLLEH